MIAKFNRFHGYGSLKGVYRRGSVVRGQTISLKFEKKPNQKTFRLSVVVSKKVHKSAVVRNRIRRRIYEIVRIQTAQNLDGYDLVFTAFSEEVAVMEQDRLQEKIEALLSKALATRV